MDLPTAYLIATAIVVSGGVLIYTLRVLHIPMRYLVWTVVAHIFFVMVLGAAVFSAPLEPSRVRAETIQVVMLPPLPEREETKEPLVVPRTEPTEPQPPKEERRPKPSPELPQWTQTTSVASRLIGNPFSASALPSQRRSAPQSLSPLEPLSVGVPPVRSDLGVLSGATPTASPSSVPRLAEEKVPTVTRLAPSDRTQRGLPESSGTDRLGPRSSTAGTTGRVDLPKGFSLTGDVKGRALRYVPDPPTAWGTTGAEVVLRFWVSPDGHVERVQFVRKAGDPNLERLAQSWVERLQFSPLPSNVEQIDQWGEVTVVFSKTLR